MKRISWRQYIKFYRYLLPFWKREMLILLLSLIALGLGLVSPYLTKLIIDKAYGNKDLNLFIILIVLGGLIFVLSGAINGISNYLNRYIKFRISFALNRKTFKKLQELPYGFFQESSTGDHLYKINYDIEQVSQFISEVLPQAVSLVPKSILIFLLLLFLNWKIALLTLALTPFLYLGPFYFIRRRKMALEAWIKNSQNIFKRLHETLIHMQLIKAFGKERRQTQDYVKSLINNLRLNVSNTRLEVTNSFANSLANRIISSSIIFYGGFQLIKGNLTLGSLTAITMYLGQLSGLHTSLAQFSQQTSLSMISCRRLETILSAEAVAIEIAGAEDFIFSENSIEFKNVVFAYKARNEATSSRQQRAPAVLNGLNFSIASGSCVGLVGPSGCGKTTIINLLLRLYAPQAGEILVARRNINTIKSQALYRQIGAVLQEPFLFDDSIENNIRFGREEADFREIEEAAHVACIDDFIHSLPAGYATIIGENACKISEGQKQRFAIARAVVKKPKILILDEALSSVDVEVEERIMVNIRKALRDSTIIVISHRLSTINRLDLIYFLQGPQGVVIDRHGSLLNQNKSYRDYLACR